MDAPSNVKSGGMTFAEQQMQRHGWTEGKGLGKREDGISEAIKVKVKCDTAGVGHNSAEQFTFHWWDHVFNKTASSISVEPDQDGVKVKKLSEGDSAVSSKKPRKAMLNRNMLYGRFIKSATLMSGGEKPMEESSSSDSDDDSEDEDAKLDLSSATKLSDEDLMKICGGRTAHKGARHGLTMSAKLSRIEEQERAFMEKYGKKETKPQPSKSTSGVESAEEIKGDDKMKKKKTKEGNVDGEGQDNRSDGDVPKKKKKRRKEESVDNVNGHDQERVSSMEEDVVNSKKKKKRSKVSDNVEMDEEAEFLGDHKNDLSVEEEDVRFAKKKKRKTKEHEESIDLHGHDGNEEDKRYENTEDEGKSKKKKKKKRKTKEHEESIDFHGHDGYENTEEEEGKSKKKKCKRSEEHQELGESEEKSRKPKKWKADEEMEENDPSTEERSKRKKKKMVDNEDELMDGKDAKATKKKKNSKFRVDQLL